MIRRTKMRYVMGYIVGAAVMAMLMIYAVNWYFKI